MFDLSFYSTEVDELQMKLNQTGRLLEVLREVQSTRLAQRPNDPSSATPEVAIKPSQEEKTIGRFHGCSHTIRTISTDFRCGRNPLHAQKGSFGVWCRGTKYYFFHSFSLPSAFLSLPPSLPPSLSPSFPLLESVSYTWNILEALKLSRWFHLFLSLKFFFSTFYCSEPSDRESERNDFTSKYNSLQDSTNS